MNTTPHHFFGTVVDSSKKKFRFIIIGDKLELYCCIHSHLEVTLLYISLLSSNQLCIQLNVIAVDKILPLGTDNMVN